MKHLGLSIFKLNYFFTFYLGDSRVLDNKKSETPIMPHLGRETYAYNTHISFIEGSVYNYTFRKISLGKTID